MSDPISQRGGLADDLRAAAAAGIVTEAQAARVVALAQARAGQRGAMGAEDEPFEFFRGFAEIFIAVGLVLFLSGVVLLLSGVGLASGTFLIVPPAVAVLAFGLADYFTRRRRMVLPSLVLALAVGLGAVAFVAGLMGRADFPNPQAMVLWSALAGAAAMGLFYLRHRLPVAMLLLGLALLVALYAWTAEPYDLIVLQRGGLEAFFDLRARSAFAAATLVFGLAAFAAAMAFDLRDPHRLGRHAATGFWLHLLAAPALVNTVALTLWNLGGTAGIAAVSAAMLLIAVLALVIDRRSFLTAGIVYIALVLGYVVGDGGTVALLIVLGALITALGTFWTALRARLMRLLPDFPGKSRLPPYAEAP